MYKKITSLPAPAPTPPPAPKLVAHPTSSAILVNGEAVAFDAYSINDNNYFKLRDIGQAFDFGVTWDGATNTIIIDTGKGYTP